MSKTTYDPRQPGLFKPEATWRPPAGVPNIDELLRSRVIGMDTETRDPNLKTLGQGWVRGDGEVVGISLAWHGAFDELKSVYLPIAHGGGDNMDPTPVIAFMIDLMKRYTGRWVVMNGLYDFGWLLTLGVKFNEEAKVWDVGWVAALLNEHRSSYSLKNIAKYHNLAGKDESMLEQAAWSYGVDPKGGLHLLPARYVGAYAEQDALLPVQVFYQQLRDVECEQLMKVVELEHSLYPCLLEMKRRGVKVNIDKANGLKEKWLADKAVLVGRVKDITGLNVDVFSAESCAKAFDQQGIEYRRTGRGAPSFTEEWLSSHPSELAKLITQARKKDKAANAFCQSMIIDHAHNGRIHCNFHPLRSDEGGAVSGRFSCSDPNLQQVPARDPEIGPAIRDCFEPEDGEEWAAVDYSQQEPRLQVHYAEERGCSRGAEVAARYRENPDTDYHNLVAELAFGKNFTPKDRKNAKTINLGLAYGMGGPKLCMKLGLPTKEIETNNGRIIKVAGDEGQALLDRYFTEVPFVKELSAYYTEQANVFGYVRTLSGRRCRFHDFEPKFGGGLPLPYDEACRRYGQNNIKRSYTHAALNRKIQGGSADMIKVSLRNLWRAGYCPLVTIHDENGLSLGSRQQVNEVSDIMRNCVKLRVPLKVDVDLGPSWGKARPMEDEE